MVSTPGLTKSAILTGPTASGKTALALELARKSRNIEIINADSLLVFRELNIGTAKPSAEELKQVKHHLIDIKNPNEDFNAADFVKEAKRILSDIESRGKRALFVGGSGFYLKALLYGTWDAPGTDLNFRRTLEKKSNQDLHRKLLERDPTSAARIGPADRYRLIRALELIFLSGKSPTELQAELPKDADPRFVLWVVDRPKEEIDSRILARTKSMLDHGLIDEVKSLRSVYPENQTRPLRSVGYAQVLNYLNDFPPAGRKLRPGLEGLQDEIILATQQLVKTQRTWFKSQKESQWFQLDHDREKLMAEFTKIYGPAP